MMARCAITQQRDCSGGGAGEQRCHESLAASEDPCLGRCSMCASHVSGT
ncbi:MAG: hypothetical protein SPL48_10160 [Bacteroidales bacterium]|nr:hypothetical protein [Bacteroidales bacterium]